MTLAKHRELQGLPEGPGTLLACRARKASEGSWHLSQDQEDGMKQIREKRGGMVIQAEAPACAKAGTEERMERECQARSGKR